MAVEDDNVRALKGAYARWAESKGKDLDGWMALADETLRLRTIADDAPEMRFAQPRDGKAQLLEFLTDLTDDWEMVTSEANEFVAQGDRVVVIGRAAWKNKATGKVADTPKVDIYRFRDGRVVEYSELYDTARAIAAATP